MVEVHIPAELAVDWEQVVKERYGGDAEKAALEAIRRLVEQERREIVDEARFDQAVRKIQDRRARAQELSDSEFSGALAKRQRRMERARQLFGSLGKEASPTEEEREG